LNWLAKAGLGLALCAASLAPALADNNTGSVYGWVYARGTNRTPVCPMTMRAHSNREPDTFVTTHNGKFDFLALRPGPVAITVDGETRVVDVHAALPTQTTFYVRARSHNCGRRP